MSCFILGSREWEVRSIMAMSNKKLLIFGIGEQAEVADYYFTHHTDLQVVGFCVDSEFLEADTFCGRPVVASENATQAYPPAECQGFVAIGYSKLNTLRAAKYEWMKSQGYQLASYISHRATVLTDRLGDNLLILEENTIQPFVTIGNDVTLWSGNHIGHHSTIGNHAFITSHVVCSGGVEIGERCFIGVNATIRDHITIGDDNLIGAGAIILKSTSDNEVYPAVRTRPKEGLKATSIDRI